MDMRKVRDGMLEVEEERKRIQTLISNAEAALDVGRAQAFSNIHSELAIVEGLMKKLEEKVLLVQEMMSQSKCNFQVETPELDGQVEHKNGIFTEEEKQKMVVSSILKYVKKEDLLRCRSINSHWHYQVISLLKKSADSTMYNLRCDLNLVCKKLRGKKTLPNLHFLLSESKHPELLFGDLKISNEIVKRYKTAPLNIPSCHYLLQNFGKFVKKLEVTDDEDFNILRKCLGSFGYCPIVEDLKVIIHQDCNEEFSSCALQRFLRNIRVLKVKKMRFEYRNNDNPILMFFQDFVLMIFEGIIENSPDMEDLTVVTWSKSSICHTHHFINVLQSKPKAMGNLKEFTLWGNVLDNFEPLCQLHFGPNLKTISFIEKNGRKFVLPKEKQKEGLCNFLTLVSPFLEFFRLIGFRRVNLNDIPLMPNLTELSFKGNSETLSNFNFLQNCPSLKRLELEGCGTGFKTFQGFLDRCLQQEDQSQSSTRGTFNRVPQLIHASLEEIKVDKSSHEIIEHSCMIQFFNVAFPNFSRLEIQLRPPNGCWVEEHRLWFEECFSFISKMKNLKILSLDFCDVSEWKRVRVAVDLREAFLYLKRTQSLVHLNLQGFRDDDFKTNLIASSLPDLVGAPKLRQITFRCLPIKDEKLKSRIPQFIDEFAKNRILLEMKNEI